MEIETSLYAAAAELAKKRYPKGWGGAAAIQTETGNIYTSVAPDVENDSLNLCIEVGAFLQAHKFNEKVTHCLCLYRDSEEDDFIILSPCGICQERLTHWGGDVLAAVSNEENQLIFKTIRELQPHHWSLVNGKKL